MKVLVTGADGYIGVRLAHVLIERGHDVTGLDAGFHRSGWLYESGDRRPAIITKDTRHVTADDLEGFDAVVHCAEISNDPVGELDPDITHAINLRGTVALAEQAKAAGVERFVHMSSCSVYGASGERDSVEGDPTEPLTAYATCKVLVEERVGAMADDRFSPTFLRNATAYGASPRQRFDIAVNNLAGWAWTTKVLQMQSDGTPWRPFVHILDIAKAAACVLEADRDVIHGEIFNTGDDRSNHQIRDIAHMITEAIPGCRLDLGQASPDRRDYRADFTKISTRLPGFSCDWTVQQGVEELVRVFASIDLDEAAFRSRHYTRLDQIKWLRETGQIDEAFFVVPPGGPGQVS